MVTSLVSCSQANNDNPEFATTYKSTEQKVEVVFSHLEVLLHEDALISVMTFGQEIAQKLSSLKPEQPADEKLGERQRRNSNLSDIVDMVGKHAAKTGQFNSCLFLSV